MTGYPGTTHRHIHPDQQPAVDRLEAKYAHLGLRFDTGFGGSVPVQASGRIGRRFFYFRFRYDTASLTVGSPDRRRDAGYARTMRTKALRATRRFTGDPMDRFWAELGLRPTLHLERHPSIPVRRAAIHDVTGDEYAGELTQDEAEALFIRLMAKLEPAVKPALDLRHMRAVMKRRRTIPAGPHRHVITKRPRRR